MRPWIWMLSTAILPLSALGAASDSVPMVFQEKNGHFDIHAQFQVPADPTQAWEILTDFQRYPKYSHELKKVEVTPQGQNHWQVEEMAESGFLFITQKVYFQLRVSGVPGRSLVSEDIGHRSFVSYKTAWEINPLPGGKGSELHYHLEAEGHFGGPAFMVNDHFSGGVRNFLEAVREEMKRKQ